MNIYFPIAEVSANIYTIAFIGILAGMISNIFGIGGGFIATPFLISIGIPPYIATACATHQIVGSSFMGVLAKLKNMLFDIKLATMLAFFGIFGSFIGVMIIKKLHTLGYVDVIISLSYAIVMLSTAFSILLHHFRRSKNELNDGNKKSFIETLPYKIYFKKSEMEISIYVIVFLGSFVGVLTGIMGIGGGFITVPIMTYILKIKKEIIIGTSLMQIFIITLCVTAMNIFTTESLDLLLGINLIIGGILGSFAGNLLSKSIKFERINFLLALLVLSVSIFFVINLIKTPNAETLFTMEATH